MSFDTFQSDTTELLSRNAIIAFLIRDQTTTTTTTTIMSESSSTPKKQQEERILVLYGSHSGTAERVAETLCAEIPEKLSPELEQKHNIVVQAVGPLALDDFLQQPAWTRLVIIVVSSFGLGHAPRNARQFRKLCDHWVKEFPQSHHDKKGDKDDDDDDNNGSNNKNDDKPKRPLVGLQFAMLGLGSSMYSTYQQNPTAIANGLIAAGATLVGDRGSADSAAGEAPQQEEITEWCQGLWQPLQQALLSLLDGDKTVVPTDEQLQAMNEKTVLA